MANDNKNAPGSQGQGQGSGQTGKQNQGQGQGQDPSRKDASSNSGGRPGDKPQYDADRPGYDVDVETEIPGGRKNASAPDRSGQGKSGMGWGEGGDRPQTDGSAGSRPPGQRPDDERQTKKSP